MKKINFKNKKIVIPIICFGVLLFAGLIGLLIKFGTGSFLTSAYYISDVEANFDHIKPGTSINYNINGVSDWKVLYVDRSSRTIEVVSNKNVEDVTLTPSNYKNVDTIFQNIANKYTDDMYAISARTVSREDLDNFAFNQRFWLSNKTEVGVEYNDGAWVGKPFDNNKKVYIIPYIRLKGGNYCSYSNGGNYSYSVNGIDDWYIGYRNCYTNSNSNSNYIDLYSYNPIEILVDEGVDIQSEVNSYFAGFKNDSNINNYGSSTNYIRDYNRSFIDNLTEDTYFFGYGSCSNNPSISDEIGYDIAYYRCNCIYKYDVERQSFNSCETYTQYRNKILKLGYRPVVTLKIDAAKDTSKKDISSKLKIGDYVNYSAKNYSGWRVLSIDNEAGTVDIVSSGIVKNIQLYGIDDYENYEMILQNEVDSYKNGDNVISARALEYDDRENLSKMKDKVVAKYWLTDKRDYNKMVDVKSDYYYNEDETSSKISIEHAFYEVAYMYYDKGEENAITKKYGKLFYTPTGSEKTYYGNSLTFVAGVRPVITLKLDNVELIDSDDVSKLESFYSKLDNKIINEQNEKNNTEKKSSANTGNGNVYSYSTINSINSNGGSSNSSSGSRNSGVTSSTNKSDNNVSGSCGSGCCQVTAKNSIISKGYLRFIFYVLLLIFIVLLLMFACFVFLTNKVSCYIDNKEEKDNDILKTINKDDDSLS